MNLRSITPTPRHVALVSTSQPAPPASPKGATASPLPLISGWLTPAAA